MRTFRRRPDVAVLAWLRLARVFQKVDRHTAQFLRKYGLSVAQFDVLAQIGAHEGLTQQELADALLVTKGNICQLVDRMERLHFLERRQEGRANRLYLTPQGKMLYARLVPEQEAHIAALLSSLDDTERAALLSLLRRLDRSLA